MSGPQESISVKEARQQFSKLLALAQRGRSIAITRRGKTVARITPPETLAPGPLPDLAEFRASLSKPPKKTRATIMDLRDAERA